MRQGLHWLICHRGPDLSEGVSVNRKMLLGLGVIVLVVIVALITIRPFATSGTDPGSPSPHAIDQ